MLENPGDELYFGEVYRQVLQEAWLPEGAEDWMRVGKSRRGRRPTQQGLIPRSPTEDQAVVRQCFSKCVMAWNRLPWDTPHLPGCDDRWGKEYWKKEKDDRGVPCSYYDLFMRYCLRHCLDTGCVMPSARTLDCGPDLTDIYCWGEYNIPFSGQCGSLSLIAGPGVFTPPSTWKAPLCGEKHVLYFKDKDGATGCLPISFDSSYYCDGLSWPDTNPDEIPQDSELPIFIEGGAPPYHWVLTGTDFSLASSHTDVLSNTLISGPAACGSAKILVVDFCGTKITGSVRSSVGTWIEISTGECGLAGLGAQTGTAGAGDLCAARVFFELKKGGQWQKQTRCHVGQVNPGVPCSEAGPCPSACAGMNEQSCGDPLPGNCIDPDASFYPCTQQEIEGLCVQTCYCVKGLVYYEWRCW